MWGIAAHRLSLPRVLSRDGSTKRPPSMAACRRPFVIRVVVSCAYVKTDIFGSSFSRQSV